MRFTDYMQLDEIATSMKDVDVSDVQLTGSSDSATHRWQRGNDKYNVYFSKQPSLQTGDYGDGDIISNKRYSILFSGPEGVSPTNRGEGAQDVYNELLKGTKAFLDKYEPEVLNFSGAEAAMDLVYNQFMTRFLSGKEGEGDDRIFVRINDYNWLRKDTYDKLPSDTKTEVDAMLEEWKGNETAWLKNKRDIKNRARKHEMLRKKYNNKFLVFDPGGRSQGVKTVFVTGMGGSYMNFVFIENGSLEYDEKYVADLARSKEGLAQFGEPITIPEATDKLDLDKLQILLSKIKENSGQMHALTQVPQDVRDKLKALYEKVTVTQFLKNVKTQEGAPTLTQKLQRQQDEPTPTLTPAQQQQQGARVSRGLGGRVRRTPATTSYDPSTPTEPWSGPGDIWD